MNLDKLLKNPFLVTKVTKKITFSHSKNEKKIEKGTLVCLAWSSLETEAFPFMFAAKPSLRHDTTAKEEQTERGR